MLKISRSKDCQNQTSWRETIIGILSFFFVIALWCGSWYLIDTYVQSSTPTTQTHEVARGVFGDKFGAVNALFAGLAFAGIIWTLILQRRDLALQRQEIQAAKQETIEQNETLRRQQFENTLFQMLGLHTDLVQKLVISSHSSRDAFEYFIELIKLHTPEFRAFHALRKLTRDEIHQMKGEKDIPESVLPRLDESEKEILKVVIEKNFQYVDKYNDENNRYHLDLINSAYGKAHEKSKDGLSHYFRNLYTIFKYIDDSDEIEDQEKIKYSRIVRAQLSDQELVAIFYNCIVEVEKGKMPEMGYPKMTALVSRYDLLQNLNFGSVIHKIHMNIFEERAKLALGKS